MIRARQILRHLQKRGNQSHSGKSELHRHQSPPRFPKRKQESPKHCKKKRFSNKKMQRKWSAHVINNRGKESIGNLFQNTIEEPAMNARRTVLSEGFWDSVKFHEHQIERGKEV